MFAVDEIPTNNMILLIAGMVAFLIFCAIVAWADKDDDKE